MSPFWTVLTARLVLTPVGGADLPDLIALKADARVFGIMLGGVRSAARTMEELAEEVACWGAHGWGIWAIRARDDAHFVGVTGFMHRPDGRGIALRFALGAQEQGQGLAREAASAALRYGHEQAGLARIVAVARASNFASRMVLGGIGMTEAETFTQAGHPMVLYESLRPAAARTKESR